MSAEEFMNLPEGQRTLILVKLDDVVESSEPNLQFAAARFLELLLTRGILLERESYRRIVEPAINHGFEREYGQSVGRRTLRDALESASSLARAEAHSVLQDEFIAFMGRAQLETIPDCLLYECREVLQTLLANPACNHGAKILAVFLRRVNREQSDRGIQRAARSGTAIDSTGRAATLTISSNGAPGVPHARRILPDQAFETAVLPVNPQHSSAKPET
jgi:hypothetical protein